jgi:hypothetical protein
MMFDDDSPNQEFKYAVQNAIDDNNVDAVKQLLFSNEHINVGVIQKDRERIIFTSASIAFKYYGKAEDVLKYLIFAHHINMHAYIDSPFVRDEKIENMFAIRKIHNELESTLNNGSNKPNKTIKI